MTVKAGTWDCPRAQHLVPCFVFTDDVAFPDVVSPRVLSSLYLLPMHPAPHSQTNQNMVIFN